MLFSISMARASLMLSVLIASPSDVSAEREAAVKAVSEWNASHAQRMKIYLDPIRWETHSHPSSGDRPQGIINRQMVDECDFVIGIFGVRIGTPTGAAKSGTIEEIERLRQQGKLIALYFSNADLPRDYDEAQLRELNEYQQARKKDCLCGSFSTPEELKAQVIRHLPGIVEDVHKRLTSSGKLDSVEKELEAAQAAVSRDLKQLADAERVALDPLIPLSIEVEVEKQYPEGPSLRVTANKDIEVTRVDYVDDHGVKLQSLKYSLSGRSIEVQILPVILTDIWNRKGQSYHLTFRLTIVEGRNTLTKELPTLIERRSKPLTTGGLTFYNHVSG